VSGELAVIPAGRDRHGAADITGGPAPP
jgi:hypothetical protein